MATQSAQFEPFAWWLARESIGHALRKRYAVPKEPPHMIALISTLNAVENDQPPLRKLVRKLDAINVSRLLSFSGTRSDREQIVEARIIAGIKAFPDWFVLT
jgi:hypothetical protein